MSATTRSTKHTMTRFAILTFVLSISSLTGCSEDVAETVEPTAVGGSGGAGGVDDPAGVGGGGAAGGQGGAGGSGVEPLPAVVTACAAPTAVAAASWSAASGERFDAVHLTQTGADAAVLYAESTGSNTWDVKLQRLDLDGNASGAPVAVGDVVVQGTVLPLPRPVLSLAARGETYVACWTGAGGGGSVACATISPAGVVLAGLSEVGESPSVAMGPAGVGLLYVSGDELRSQLLAPDAMAAGSHHVVATSSPAFPFVPGLSGGASSYLGDVDIFFSRFDASFDELEGQSAAGWTSLRVSLATSGDVHGAVWGALDGVRARVLGPTDDDFGPDVRVDGGTGGTSAATTALARADASFATVWAENAELRYAAFDLAATPIGGPVDAFTLPASTQSLAMTGTPGGFLAAAATGPSVDTLAVVRLTCP